MDRAALKAAYKRSKTITGVYSIGHPANKKIFIGCSLNIVAKINRHKAELRFGSHRNAELQELQRVLGETELNYEIIDVLEIDEKKASNGMVLEELQLLTEMWIGKLERAGYSVAQLP